MTLALLAVVLAQAAEPAPAEAVTPPPAPVKVDPGWARNGASFGFLLSGVPLALTIGSVIAVYTKDGTFRDWMQVAAGVSAPLAGLLPTLGSRSAVLDDESARRPRILRIVGWVLTIYGAVSLVGGVLSGIAYRFIVEKTGFNGFGSGGTFNDVTTAIGSASTLFSGALASAGVLLLSMGAKKTADLAELGMSPAVTIVPTPAGGVAVMAGLSGRL